ncbi:MAG: HNH endonuclease [Gemmataceae bacterium]
MLEPFCRTCRFAGQLVKAKHVDHIKSRRKGGTNDHSNLRSLCHSCHSRKTCKHDGGFGHKPKPEAGIGPTDCQDGSPTP